MNEKLRSLIAAYCAAAPAQAAAIEALARDLSEGALERMRAETHRMAGTARSMGLEAFGARLVSLETRVREGMNDPGARAGIIAESAALSEAAGQLQPNESKLWSAPDAG